MKKTAQDFGSHWNRPASRVRTEESAETTCDSKDDYLGFRLARGGGFQAYMGRAFNNGVDIPSMVGGEVPKGIGHNLLGFRLSYDKEDK
jgi:hypothetical protein